MMQVNASFKGDGRRSGEGGREIETEEVSAHGWTALRGQIFRF